jgi:hypothetical protein
MLFFASFAASLIQITLTPESPTYIWSPPSPHSIIIFPKPPDSSLVVEIVSRSNQILHSLSQIPSVLCVNFGTDTTSSLRFTRGSSTQSIYFEAFIPANIPDHYILSTLSRENFALSSPGLCGHPDFELEPFVSYGLFYLNKEDVNITNPISKLTRDDHVRCAIYDTQERPRVQELNRHDRIDMKIQAFSEWIIKIGADSSNQVFVLLLRSSLHTVQSLPEIYAVFSRDSGLTVIQKAPDTQSRIVRDDPCTFDTSAAIELKSGQKKGTLSLSLIGALAIGIAGIGFLLILIIKIIFKSISRTKPYLNDLDGLLDRSEGRRPGDFVDLATQIDTYGIPAVVSRLK